MEPNWNTLIESSINDFTRQNSSVQSLHGVEIISDYSQVGFEIIDVIAEAEGIPLSSMQFKAMVGKGNTLVLLTLNILFFFCMLKYALKAVVLILIEQFPALSFCHRFCSLPFAT